MKTVFVSATGNYQQGNLTPQLFRDLCESYDPAIYEAGAFVAHSTKWAAAGMNEPPRLASVKSLSDSFIGTGGRVFLSTNIEPNADYEDAQQYFPHKSIEFWDATDPRNPLNQPHIPAGKQGKPYFRGYALLGDSPAAKLPASITKFFGELNEEKRAELAQYCDEKAGLYCYKDTFKPTNNMGMSAIAKALGLPETATEEQIISRINKAKDEDKKEADDAMKEAKGEYQDKITALETEVQTLKANAGTGVKEYSDKVVDLEAKLKDSQKSAHGLQVKLFIQSAQAKNPTVGAEKLTKLKTFADLDFERGDKEYKFANIELADIPENKMSPIGKGSGKLDTDTDKALSGVKCFADLAKDAGLRNLFAEHRPEEFEKMVSDPAYKLL